MDVHNIILDTNALTVSNTDSLVFSSYARVDVINELGADSLRGCSDSEVINLTTDIDGSVIDGSYV